MIVRLVWKSRLFKLGFSHSTLLAVSKIEKQFSLARLLQDTGSFKCLNTCEFLSLLFVNIANSIYELKLKKSLHNEWEKPNLNKQLFHSNLTLMF